MGPTVNPTPPSTSPIDSLMAFSDFPPPTSPTLVEQSPKSPHTALPTPSQSTKKKYKPVALKVKPVVGELPDKFRIVRNITGDPLEKLPTLNPHPPPFKPHGRYTQERKELFDAANPGFLQPTEQDLLHHFMTLHQDAFAWNDTERGHFREDFFPPVDIPVVQIGRAHV